MAGQPHHLECHAIIGSVASNLGDHNLSDYEALLSVEAALAGLNGATLEGVLIYDPSINNGDPADACFSGGTPQDSAGGRCNFYSAADIASMTTATFSTTSTCGSWDQYYCPINRSVNASSLDDVGVWLRIDRSWFTEVFPGDGITMEDQTIMRLEPET